MKAKIKEGKIAYRFDTPIYPSNILYINLIARYSCVNDCKFCGRPRKEEDIGKSNIYEKKAKAFLYLEKSPSIKFILEEIKEEIKDDDKEIAFIGLGEPLIYLSKILKIVKKLKSDYPNIRVRIDTNGATKEIDKNPIKVARDLEKAGLDEIRVSVNAINQEEYNLLCCPKFKDAFPKLIEFVKVLSKSRVDTFVSFVVGFKDEILRSRSKEDYMKFALSLGVKKQNIILRDYINIHQ